MRRVHGWPTMRKLAGHRAEDQTLGDMLVVKRPVASPEWAFLPVVMLVV